MANEYDGKSQPEHLRENPATDMSSRNPEHANKSEDCPAKTNGETAENEMQDIGGSPLSHGAQGVQATPEMPQPAEQLIGTQQSEQRIVSKPKGGTSEPAQPSTQPEAKHNGPVSPSEARTNSGGGKFDPARWRKSADTRLDPQAKIQPASHSKIEVRKPPPDHYVRVHKDPAFNDVFPLYSDSMAKGYDPYLIAPELEDLLPPQVKVNIKPVRLAVTTTDSGRPFQWFIAQTGSDWHESGDQCILTAMTQWVKVLPDGNGYRLEYPEVDLPGPVFPDWSFEEYLTRAFKDRYIDDLAHAVIKRLAGIR
jgi:hypothetical protein